MATTLPLPATRGTTRTQGTVATRETAWRLAGATLTGLATTLFLFGTAWDIQWHPAVGRDRALTSPHQFMLAGIGLAGLVALALILLDTWRARRGLGVDGGNSRRMFRVFQAPVGFAVVGFGALLSTIAFPLDDYWHTLYGVDVTLWAPFHVMIIFGMVMAELGTITVLASEMNRMAPGRGKTGLQVGIAAMLAVLLATVAMFLVQADWVEGLAHLGTYSLALYPILLAFMLPVALVSAVRVTRLPGAATILALVFLAIRTALYAFVPWGMAWGIATEGVAYRPNPPVDVLVPYAYPLTILAAALVLDAVAWLTRREGWSDRAVLATGVVTAVGVTLVDKPWARMLKNFVYPDMDVNAVLLNALPFALVAAGLGAGLAVLMSRGLRAERQ